MRKMNVPARSRSDEKPSREIGPPIPFKFTQLDPLQPYSWEKKIKKQVREDQEEAVAVRK